MSGGFFEENYDFCIELDQNIFLLLGGIIVGGIVVTLPVEANGGILLQILFWVSGFKCLLEQLKEHHEYIFDFLNRTERFLGDFLYAKEIEKRMRGNIWEREEVNKPLKTKGSENGDEREGAEPSYNKWAVALWIAGAVIIIYKFLIWNGRRLSQLINGDLTLGEFQKQNLKWVIVIPLISLALVITCMTFCGLFREEIIKEIQGFFNRKQKRRIRQKLQKAVRESAEERIEICPDLCAWKDDIYAMCSVLEIKRVVFSVDIRIGMNAITYIREDDFMPVIIVGEKLLCVIHNQFGKAADSVLCFILGHELAHIYSRDGEDYLGRSISRLAKILFVFFLADGIYLLLHNGEV